MTFTGLFRRKTTPPPPVRNAMEEFEARARALNLAPAPPTATPAGRRGAIYGHKMLENQPGGLIWVGDRQHCVYATTGSSTGWQP